MFRSAQIDPDHRPGHRVTIRTFRPHLCLGNTFRKRCVEIIWEHVCVASALKAVVFDLYFSSDSCIHIYIERDTYIYIYMYIWRESERERERKTNAHTRLFKYNLIYISILMHMYME